MSKAADKLAKLAGFGMLAGSEPAASAREVMKATPAPAPQPVESTPAAQVAETPGGEPETAAEAPKMAKPAPKAGEGSASGKPKSKPIAAPARENLTRNVVFLAADQVELDRIEDLLRLAGIRKPTIADLVRVALRAAKPAPEEAALIFAETKTLDSRRAENKKKPLVK